MGRGYHRKTQQFKPEDMKKAVELVIKNGYSLRAASEQFDNISVKTLWR